MSERKHKDDVLDPVEARRFLWRRSDPPPEPVPAPTPPAAPPQTTEERAREDAHAVAKLREIAARIDRVWRMSGKTQALATIALLDEVDCDLPSLLGLSGAPELCVRFARLVVRHYDRLPSRRRKSLTHSLSWLDLDGPEVGALLVDVARRGDHWLLFMIQNAMGKRSAWRHVASAVPELGRILTESKSWASREAAVYFLAGANTREAVQLIRRALRQPHLGLRYAAIRVLEPDKGELTEADLRFLIEDAVAHPLEEGFGERHGDATYGYPRALLRALRFVRHDEVTPSLELMANHGGKHIRCERHGLDDAWALTALAIVAPEVALPTIRRRLLGNGNVYAGVAAAIELPEPQAAPLLEHFVTGADRHAIEHARRGWAEKYGRELPVPQDARILDGLVVPLEGAPSEQFLSRLTVLRTGPDEARSALVEVLLREPADHENFVLLTFLLGRSSSLYWLKAPSKPALDHWADFLLDRYGAKGERVLMELAERDAAVRHWYGWANHASSVRSRLAPASIAPLRAALERALDDLPSDREREEMLFLLLDGIGPSPAALHRLWELAIEQPTAVDERRFYTDGSVIRALARLPPDPVLDARLVESARAALVAGDRMRARRLLYAAWERKAGAALDLAREIVDAADSYAGDEAGRGLLTHAGYELSAASRLDIAWIRACLDDPASWRFDVAEAAIRKDWPAEPERRDVMRLLDAAASSAARSGRPRAIALSSLVWWREIDCSDPRIADALGTSEPGATALLLGRMDLRDELHRDTLPADAMNRARLRVLKEGSAKDALEVLEDVYRSPPPGFTDLLERALSRGEVHAEAVDAARHICGIPSEAELYWQDDTDEEDEDEADC